MDDIKTCPKCGKVVIDSFNYCPFCGATIKRNCLNCGEPLVADARFCSKCGASVCDSENREVTKESKHNHVANEKKAHKRTSSNTARISGKGISVIVKSVLIAVVCVLLFAFSFASVMSVDLSDNSILSLGTITIDGKVELNAIDIIKIAFASARHYDPDKDVAKAEKLEENAELALEDFLSAIVNDIGDDKGSVKIEMSRESERAAKDYVVKLLEYYASIDVYGDNSTDMLSGGSMATIATAGALLFVNIFATATIMVLAILSAIRRIIAVCQGKDVKLSSTIDVLMPILLALPISAVLALTPLGAELGACLIAGIVFSSLAIAASFVLQLIESKKPFVTHIPQIVTLALCVVIIGCCFAPSFKATFNTKLSGSGVEREYSSELYASAMADCIASEAEKEYVKGKLSEKLRNYWYFTEILEKEFKEISKLTAKDFVGYDGIVIQTYATLITRQSIMAQLGVGGAGTMALGYFALIFAVLFASASMCLAMKSFDDARLAIAFNTLTVIMLVLALSISIAMTSIVGYQMKTMDSEVFRLTLGGGIIGALIMSVGMLVVNALPTSVWTRKKSESVEDDVVEEQSNTVEENDSAFEVADTAEPVVEQESVVQGVQDVQEV